MHVSLRLNTSEGNTVGGGRWRWRELRVIRADVWLQEAKLSGATEAHAIPFPVCFDLRVQQSFAEEFYKLPSRHRLAVVRATLKLALCAQDERAMGETLRNKSAAV